MSGLKDFSVDAQRRMFVEQQERERRIAEDRKASRRAGRARSAGGAAAKATMVDDDDDYSVDDENDDGDRSINSEESFYVGIERADYAQPDSAEIYGGEEDDDGGGGGRGPRGEDRLGIARVGGVGVVVGSDWDADVIPIHNEGCGSFLHDFMNGVVASGDGGGHSARGRNPVVAVPHVDPDVGWTERSGRGPGTVADDDDDDAGGVDQVYNHGAAEGKAFIETIVAGGASPPGGKAAVPVLSPVVMYSPGIVFGVGGAEDNGARQMRERELRKEASADAVRRMVGLRNAIAAAAATGTVDANELMKKMDEMMNV
jgi:hypothetical protein